MSISIKNIHIPTLLKALSALDGRQEVIEVDAADGKTKRALNTVPYSFSGKARLRAGQWIAAVRAQAEILNDVQDKLIRQFSDKSDPTKVAPKNDEAFAVEMTAVNNDLFTVELEPIPVEDLKVEDNQIPVSVLGVLAPILA
jgi:hypothetical protein